MFVPSSMTTLTVFFLCACQWRGWYSMYYALVRECLNLCSFSYRQASSNQSDSNNYVAIAFSFILVITPITLPPIESVQPAINGPAKKQSLVKKNNVCRLSRFIIHNNKLDCHTIKVHLMRSLLFRLCECEYKVYLTAVHCTFSCSMIHCCFYGELCPWVKQTWKHNRDSFRSVLFNLCLKQTGKRERDRFRRVLFNLCLKQT